ncbi:hypothetical protein ACLKA7_013686 [Drosophila subpalustris]
MPFDCLTGYQNDFDYKSLTTLLSLLWLIVLDQRWQGASTIAAGTAKDCLPASLKLLIRSLDSNKTGGVAELQVDSGEALIFSAE